MTKDKIRILYGIQCTGNGHITRSKEIIKYINKHYKNVKIDVCLSGNFSQIDTSDLDVKWKFRGLGFSLDKGGIKLIKTMIDLDLIDFFRSVRKLNLSSYDIIISDFEPVTCWSGLLRGRDVIGIGNHYKFLQNKNFLKNISPNFFWNRVFSKLISPVKKYLSFDYIKDTKDEFFPIIRQEIRNSKKGDGGYYILYLSSIPVEHQIRFLSFFTDQKFIIYHNAVTEDWDYNENIKVKAINNKEFLKDLVKCSGVITHGGFQLTSESLFLGKKLLVMPIKNQIEQIWNSKSLSKLGVVVTNEFDTVVFSDFFENDYSVKLNYIDELDRLSKIILNEYL
jgi:uncharacterized protein (TIGR00661 family)